jgi:DHA2 family multidrug resistance protein-like MFS transporter
MTVSFLFISSWINLKVGYRRAILLSFLFVALFTVLMGFSRSYAELALLCFVVGIGSGIYIPAVYPLLTSVFEQRHWGKVISFNETGAALSSPMVPLLTALALGYLEWRSLFFILAGLSVGDPPDCVDSPNRPPEDGPSPGAHPYARRYSG